MAFILVRDSDSFVLQVNSTSVGAGAGETEYNEVFEFVPNVDDVTWQRIAAANYTIADNGGGPLDDQDNESSFVKLEDEGTPVTNTPHNILNFTGAGVTVTDAGSGVATLTITSGSGGSTDNAVPLTDNAVVRGDGGADGVQDSGVIIDDSDEMTGVTCLEIIGSSATHRLMVRNNTVSGELINGYNNSGIEIFQLNQDGSGNAILRVENAASQNVFEVENGQAVIKSNGALPDAEAGYVFTIRGESGDSGLFIKAGEVDGDIAIHVEDQDGTFMIMELDADSGELVLGATLAATITANGTVYGVDNQKGAGDAADFNTENGTYRIAGVDVVIPAGGTTGQVLEKVDGTSYNTQWATPAGGGGDPEIPNVSTSQNTTFTSTATTPVVLTGTSHVMTQAGKWMISFSGSGEGTAKDQECHIGIYVDGVLVANTDRTFHNVSGHLHTMDFPIHSQIIEDFLGTETVDIRGYSDSGDDWHIFERSFICIRLGA